MKKLAKAWLEFARSDVEAARHLANAEGLRRVASFHCQQCIEKSFKALLEDHDKPVPRIHDLITLHGLINELSPIDVDEDILRQINDTYIDTRYPMTGPDDVGSEPSSDKVQKFIGITTTVFDTVFRKILPTDEGEERLT